MSKSDYMNIPNTAKLLVIAPAETHTILAGKLKALRATADTLPEEYDTRSKFNILQPYDQGNCGCCWAVSTASTFTDRLIVSKGAKNIEIDPLQLARCIYASPNCIKNNTCEKGENCIKDGLCDNGDATCLKSCESGCQGGYPADVGFYLEKYGGAEPVNGCKTFRNYMSNDMDKLLPKCHDAKENCIQKYKAKVGTTRALQVLRSRNEQRDQGDVDRFDISKRPANPSATLISIKTDILYKGPVVGCFIVYTDFVEFGHSSVIQNRTNRIYIKDSYNIRNNVSGGHAIEIIGWGKGDAGVKPNGTPYGIVPYWILKNSWGTDWGESGYVKFAMYPYNRECAIDVPIPYPLDNPAMYTESDNQKSYNLFGGCTAFDVDPDSIPINGSGNVNNGTGPKPGTQIGGATPLDVITTDSKKQTMVVTIVVIVVLLGLGGSAYYWREKLGLDKKKKH